MLIESLQKEKEELKNKLRQEVESEIRKELEVELRRKLEYHFAIAKRMLEKGIDVLLVAEITELSDETISWLKAHIEKAQND